MLRKYIVILMAFLLACIVGKTQKAELVKVSGKLDFAGEGQKVLELTYWKMAGRPEFDSCIVKDGKFQFEKSISEPIVALFSLRRQRDTTQNAQGFFDYYNALLLPGDITFLAKENFKTAIVSGPGAKANAEHQEFNRLQNIYIDSMNLALTPLRALTLTTEERAKRTAEITDPIKLRRDEQVYLRFVSSRPQTPVAAFALIKYAGEPVWTPRKKIIPEEIETLLERLPKTYQSYPSLVGLREELMVSKSTGIGKPIIDFQLEDTSGKMIKLSDFKGQYVFLDFWASWCVPCRKENPNVKAQFEKYHDRGFTVVSVSLDKPDAKQAWINAIRKDDIGNWTHLGDLNGFDGKVANEYYVKSIPTNFLIGPNGKFLGRNLYGDVLQKTLAKIFVKN